MGSSEDRGSREVEEPEEPWDLPGRNHTYRSGRGAGKGESEIVRRGLNERKGACPRSWGRSGGPGAQGMLGGGRARVSMGAAQPGE